MKDTWAAPAPWISRLCLRLKAWASSLCHREARALHWWRETDRVILATVFKDIDCFLIIFSFAFACALLSAQVWMHLHVCAPIMLVLMLGYMCVHVCVYVCMCVFMCVYVCTHTCMCVHVYLCVCVCLCVYVCVLMYVCVYMGLWVYMWISV